MIAGVYKWLRLFVMMTFFASLAMNIAVPALVLGLMAASCIGVRFLPDRPLAALGTILGNAAGRVLENLAAQSAVAYAERRA